VVGMRLLDSRNQTLLTDRTHDRANDLQALYVHDDRVGPGVRADIIPRSRNLALHLRVYHEAGKRSRYETWNLMYILVPLHQKIRFSFAGLRDIGLRVVAEAHAARDFLATVGRVPSDRTLTVENWVLRSTTYVDKLLVTPGLAELSRVRFLCKRIPLPRYVGVIRVTAKSGMDSIDVLLDTTSTRRNPNVIGVLPLKGDNPETRFIASWIAKQTSCLAIAPRVRVPRAGVAHRRRQPPRQRPSGSS